MYLSPSLRYCKSHHLFQHVPNGNDTAGIQLGVAYTDENGNWVESGTIITLDNRTLETFRVSLPEGNKRVAIYVVAGSGRRANLDNIKLMK